MHLDHLLEGVDAEVRLADVRLRPLTLTGSLIAPGLACQTTPPPPEWIKRQFWRFGEYRLRVNSGCCVVEPSGRAGASRTDGGD